MNKSKSKVGNILNEKKKFKKFCNLRIVRFIYAVWQTFKRTS